MTTALPIAAPALLGSEPPRVEAPSGTIDVEAAERAVAGLLVALGQDPSREPLASTPRRVAQAYSELLTSRPFELTTFPNDELYAELVLERDIPFRSFCQHHLLPFFGRAHVGYMPSSRIVGLSKLARVTQLFAARLQIQERLTQEIADYLQERLAPRGVGVVIEAEHLCVSVRGAQAHGARVITSATHGLLRDHTRARQEFLDLTRAKN